MSDIANRSIDGPPVVSLNRPTLAVAVTISVLLAAFLTVGYGWRQATLFLVGLGAGLVLYHAAFGFTSAWRVIRGESRRPAGRRLPEKYS